MDRFGFSLSGRGTGRRLTGSLIARPAERNSCINSLTLTIPPRRLLMCA